MYLLKQRSFQCVEHPNQRPLTTRGCQKPPVICQSNTRNTRLVGRYKLTPRQPVMLHPHLPLLQSQANQNHPPRRRNFTQPLRIGLRLYLMQQFQVRQIVNKHLLQRHRNNAVPPEADGLHFGTIRELASAPGQMIVPDHDFVAAEYWGGPSANYGEDIGAENHLHDTNATTVTTAGEVTAQGFSKRVGVEYDEAVGGADDEAAVVLVEGEVKERWRRSGVRVSWILDGGAGVGCGWSHCGGGKGRGRGKDTYISGGRGVGR